MKIVMARLWPLTLSLLIITADQLTKLLIVKIIPLTYPPTAVWSAFNDFIRIIHVRNPGIIFSAGASLPDNIRTVSFTLLPVIILLGFTLNLILTPAQWRKLCGKLKIKYHGGTLKESFSPLQRWSIAGIIGGGFGNIIDRIFRPEGVVDFIDVKFFGLFGWARFPTFNVADSAVTISIVILFISFLTEKHEKKAHEEV
jgi:signal peptidase II